LEVPPSLDLAARWSWRILLVGAVAVAALWLLRRLSLVLVPAFVGMLFAALFTPVVDRVATRVPRVVATWAVLLPAIAVFVAGTVLLTRPVVGEADDLRDRLERSGNELEDWLVDGPLSLEREQVDEWRQSAGQAVEDALGGLWSQAGDLASRFAEFGAGLLLTLALAFFLIKDGATMFAWTVRHLRPERQVAARTAGLASMQAIRGWLRGVALAGIIDAVLIGAGLALLGVPAWGPLAVLTFFAAFIPVVGATVAGALAALVALAANGPGTAIVVVVLVLVVQQIEGNVVLPVVMRQQVSLHPAIVLVALTAGGIVAGLVGAFLAVPVAAALTAAAGSLRAPRADDLSATVPAGPPPDPLPGTV
jgi:predicted PurR-regulated permease PerM